MAAPWLLSLLVAFYSLRTPFSLNNDDSRCVTTYTIITWFNLKNYSVFVSFSWNEMSQSNE